MTEQDIDDAEDHEQLNREIATQREEIAKLSRGVAPTVFAYAALEAVLSLDGDDHWRRFVEEALQECINRQEIAEGGGLATLQ